MSDIMKTINDLKLPFLLMNDELSDLAKEGRLTLVHENSDVILFNESSDVVGCYHKEVYSNDVVFKRSNTTPTWGLQANP